MSRVSPPRLREIRYLSDLPSLLDLYLLTNQKAGEVLMKNRPNNPNLNAQTPARFLLLSSSVNSLNFQGLVFF